MNKIYKYILLSYFFCGCSSYTPDFMAAYNYVCDVEKSKHRKECIDFETFDKRYENLLFVNNSMKTSLSKRDKKSNIEEKICNGKIEEQFEGFKEYIQKAFNENQDYEKNAPIRDLAAYASLSQTIFNILMYAFATFETNERAIQFLSHICNIFKFLPRPTVVKMLKECEDFYNDDSPDIKGKIVPLVQNIAKRVNDEVDIGVVSCVKDVEFTNDEKVNFFSTLVFILHNKKYLSIEKNNEDFSNNRKIDQKSLENHNRNKGYSNKKKNYSLERSKAA